MRQDRGDADAAGDQDLAGGGVRPAEETARTGHGDPVADGQPVDPLRAAGTPGVTTDRDLVGGGTCTVIGQGVGVGAGGAVLAGPVDGDMAAGVERRERPVSDEDHVTDVPGERFDGGDGHRECHDSSSGW